MKPPGAIELVPEDLAITPLGRLVCQKLVFKKPDSGALEISFGAMTLRGFLCI